jgi:hypothetical protein
MEAKLVLIKAGRWWINAERIVLIEQLGSTGGGIVQINRMANEVDRLQLTADELKDLLHSLGVNP